MVIKEVSCMKIVGTKQEIEWIRYALMNQCNKCPYMRACNQAAVMDQKNYGEVRHSCSEYLEGNIEFEITKNNI